MSYNLKFCTDYKEVLDHLFYSQQEITPLISEQYLLAFMENPKDRSFADFKSGLLSEYAYVGFLVSERIESEQEKQNQNQKILQITEILKIAEGLLKETKINSFPLDEHALRIHQQILDLQKEYLFADEQCDLDIPTLYEKVGIELNNFLALAEAEIKK